MIGIGDVVVCVRNPTDPHHVNEVLDVIPQERGTYRVTGVIQPHSSDSPGPGLLLENQRPITCDCCQGQSGWHMDLFKPLRKADTYFTALIKRGRKVEQPS